MRTKILSLALLLTLVATAGQAQALVYEHMDQPLFEIDFPDGWVVDLDFADEARDAGAYVEGEELALRIVEARPGDGAKIWVGLWAIPDVATLDEAVEYLSQLNADLYTAVEISRPEETKLNGMAARTARGNATHEGEDIEFLVALFEPKPGIVAMGLYVGAVDTWQGYVAELEAMVASLQPAG